MNGVLFIDDAFYKRRLEARARSGARSDVQCNCYSIAILSSTRSRVILVHFFSSVVRPCLGGVWWRRTRTAATQMMSVGCWCFLGGELSQSSASICSSVLPLVSGTYLETKKSEKRQSSA